MGLGAKRVRTVNVVSLMKIIKIAGWRCLSEFYEIFNSKTLLSRYLLFNEHPCVANDMIVVAAGCGARVVIYKPCFPGPEFYVRL